MQLKILAFGIARDIVGGKEFSFPLRDGSTVGALKVALKNQFPAFSKLRSLSIAVNSEYAIDELEIEERDEIVLIPPVSGG